MAVGLYGRLNADGSLTDIGIREQLTYGGGVTDVLMNTQPTLSNPLGYDSVNKVAISNITPTNVATQTAAAVVAQQAKGFVYGFRMYYVSTTTFNVGVAGIPDVVGMCYDSTNSIPMWPLTGGLAVDVTSNGGAQGNDAFIGPGTVSVTSGATAVTGVNTTFLTSFGTRAGSGTISSSAGTVTGTGTFFLSKLALGDLIGNATSGYFQVTAIASDTSCTIVSTPGTPFSASAYKIIENPTIRIGVGGGSPNSVSQVKAIASNTALTLSSNASGTISADTYQIGCCPNLATMPTTNSSWMCLWAGSGALASTGTSVWVSTQRTTPFGISSFNAAFRRLGSVLINAGVIVPFTQTGEGRTRQYQYEVAVSTSYLQVLSGGTATSWTAVVCARAAPPFAQQVSLRFAPSGSVGNFSSARARGAGSSTASRNNAISCTALGTSVNNITWVACDGAQCIDYANSSSALSLTLDVYGFMEQL